jgi:hypothetical protein
VRLPLARLSSPLSPRLNELPNRGNSLCDPIATLSRKRYLQFLAVEDWRMPLEAAFRKLTHPLNVYSIFEFELVKCINFLQRSFPPGSPCGCSATKETPPTLPPRCRYNC